LLAASASAARLIGLPPEALGTREFVEVFSGNRLLPGMEPYAACYGGHQFGNWAGQLGDGRAITLGEVKNDAGQRWELQLKGAGPTPYSRTADGRAVLRSSVREFLCSEAMFHLGVPTTRALCLVATGEPVLRDMSYDGNPKHEPGAIVCRMAPSFLRFGNFEIFASRADVATLGALARYTLTHHFPELGAPSPESYAAWFKEVCRRTASMVAHWMRVGFVHGVMNTDNMSILGLTIDYGPYGWLDDFNPGWTPNTTDRNGRRYRYGRQPRVALWNLVRFAESIAPLGIDVKELEAGLHEYTEVLERTLFQFLQQKLGLSTPRDGDAAVVEGSRGEPPFGVELGDSLVDELGHVLSLVETDMTLFFRQLADIPANVAAADAASDEALLSPLRSAFYGSEPLPPAALTRWAGWLRRYVRRAADEAVAEAVRRERMHAANPVYVLRNYIAQNAIDAAERGDPGLISELLGVLEQPYTEQPGKAAFALPRPDWARHRAGCSMLSCSS
jgi:uncharacterized protein YdiU (UPF0061 family)